MLPVKIMLNGGGSGMGLMTGGGVRWRLAGAKRKTQKQQSNRDRGGGDERKEVGDVIQKLVSDLGLLAAFKWSSEVNKLAWLRLQVLAVVKQVLLVNPK